VENWGRGGFVPPHICDRIREYFQIEIFNTPRTKGSRLPQGFFILQSFSQNQADFNKGSPLTPILYPLSLFQP
jgi:hypothetical protein